MNQNVTDKILHQQLQDESTVFVLAGCMISVLASFSRKDHPTTATLIENAIRVVNTDPSFLKRFRLKQEAVMKEMNRMSAAGEIVRIDADR